MGRSFRAKCLGKWNIVAIVYLQPKHTVYKAGIRLDKKVKKMLAKFPLMVQHFNKVRCQVDGFLDDDEGAEQQDATSAELEEQKKNDKGHVIEKTPRIETDHENDKGHVIEKTPRIETDHDQDDSQHVADESFEVSFGRMGINKASVWN